MEPEYYNWGDRLKRYLKPLLLSIFSVILLVLFLILDGLTVRTFSVLIGIILAAAMIVVGHVTFTLRPHKPQHKHKRHVANVEDPFNPAVEYKDGIELEDKD